MARNGLGKFLNGQKWSGRLRNGLGVRTSTMTFKVHGWESKTSKLEFGISTLPARSQEEARKRPGRG